MTETLYRFRGKGNGAVNVMSCVSFNRDSESIGAEIEVEYERSRGAKMVRCGLESTDSFRTNGFIGSGDAGRDFTGTAFAEKGRSEEIKEDRSGGSSDINEDGGTVDGLELAKRELPATLV